MTTIFDLQNGKVVPSVHCYTIKFLKDIMEEYPEDYIKVYQYLFYLTYPYPDLNPYFNIPEDEKEERILMDIEAEFDLDNVLIKDAIENCKKLYESPTARAYKGIRNMLDRLDTYMANTSITHGRDGNINSLIRAAEKYSAIRASYKSTEEDLLKEQNARAKGGQSLAYDHKQ